ncbi:hypothetical protein EDD21DRAFT_352219 [Dissophora ornata]|nr:hypothetical protein EDD21DRAFT_352219 [Dissophora ornata]
MIRLVQVFYHNKDEMILKSKEAFVVEAWDGYNPDYRLPIRASNSTKLFWGGSGSLVLEAMLSEKLHSAGGNLTVEVKVKNSTSRKVQGIRLGVHRRLEMVSNKDKAQQDPGLRIDTVSVSEVIGTQEFKSSSYLFDTGEERNMTINMIVPGNARTIRGTALFEVTCFVVVSMLLGTFSGELSVEIPVKICHPASLTPAPKPKLDENHLPHHYNLVDEDLDLKPDRSNRRIGSNDSFAVPITSGFDSGNNGQSGQARDLPWGSDGPEQQDEYSNVGRQGEWNQDAKELSPANSITSIKSLLSSPKQKLSKLADKIQRSTSPSSSHHLQHDHRQGSKHLDDSNGQGRRHLIAKSPPLGPALPIAYVPAVERVRYTPFQPPPTTKAKEFLKAAAQYQQQMAFGGALSGLGGDNVEFDIDDKKMASAIHQWISKKESEGMYSNSQTAIQVPSTTRPTPPIQIPIASPNNRRRPTVGRIDTQVGSFTSQYSPTSPQGYGSPASLRSNDFPPSPTGAVPYNNQTTSRFIHHPHRQPAAPQTEAFGSAPEDCITDPPLFAKPLPLPSPPRTGSPIRAGAMRPSARPRSLSPVPIPAQTPESLALAREAFERVKRIASPVQDHMMDAAAPNAGNSAPRSGFTDPPRPPPHGLNPDIKVPMPTSATSPNFSSSPSGLSRLLGNSVEENNHPKHARDGHVIESTPPQPCSSPELRHIPLNRPLPVPAPKPQHLNHSNVPSGSNVISGSPSSREIGFRPRPDATAPRPPAAATSSGHLRNPHPVSSSPDSAAILSTSLPGNGPATRSGHLPDRERERLRERDDLRKVASMQHNAYIPKQTPVPTAMPPVPIEQSIGNPLTGRPDSRKIGGSASAQLAGKKSAGLQHNGKLSASSGQAPGVGNNSGFIYPKAARKPVPGVRPAVAAKPMGLTPPTTAAGREAARSPPRTVAADMHSQSHAEFDQRLRRQRQQDGAVASDGKIRSEKPLVFTTSMRAPQVLTESHMSPPTQVVVGFEMRQGITTVVEEEEGEEAVMLYDTRNVSGEQQSHHHRHHHHHHETEDKKLIVASSDADIVAPESAQEVLSDMRAQAVAAKSSLRATGANDRGYVVNTGKLRQVIKESDDNSNNNAGGSGQLIQALADGARNAASAAASGLGWRQQSAPSIIPGATPVAAPIAAPRDFQRHKVAQNRGLPSSSPPSAQSQPQQQIQKQKQRDGFIQQGVSRSKDKIIPLPRSRHPPEEQNHDLTMKDIHFQTLNPASTDQSYMFDARTTAAGILPTTTTTTTTTKKHREYGQTRSHHLVTSTAPIATSQQSQSQPGSRIIDGSHGNEPLPAKTTAAVVQAMPTRAAAAAAASNPGEAEGAAAPPNLDKTLPKIQEQVPRSRVFERPERKTTDANPNVSTPTSIPSGPGKSSANVSANVNVGAKPVLRQRYEQGVGGESPAAGTGVAGGVRAGTAPKAINPRLQAYIQKYNLAANTNTRT